MGEAVHYTEAHPTPTNARRLDAEIPSSSVVTSFAAPSPHDLRETVQSLSDEVRTLRHALKNSTMKVDAWESWYRKEKRWPVTRVRTRRTSSTEIGNHSSFAWDPYGNDQGGRARTDGDRMPLKTMEEAEERYAALPLPRQTFSTTGHHPSLGNGECHASSLRDRPSLPPTREDNDHRPALSPTASTGYWSGETSIASGTAAAAAAAAASCSPPHSTPVSERDGRPKKNMSMPMDGVSTSTPFAGEAPSPFSASERSGNERVDTRNPAFPGGMKAAHFFHRLPRSYSYADDDTVAVIAKGRAIRDLALEELQVNAHDEPQCIS